MIKIFYPLTNIRYSIPHTRNSNRGFTLIELIIFIVIAGIFVPLAYVAFSKALTSGTTPENITTARFLAEKKMEEIMDIEIKLQDEDKPIKPIKKFIEEKDYQPHPKFLESLSRTSFEDIQNYQNFKWKWTIGYITYTIVSDNPRRISISDPSDFSSKTNYLKIVVYVKEPQGYDYKVYTIVTKRPGAS